MTDSMYLSPLFTTVLAAIHPVKEYTHLVQSDQLALEMARVRKYVLSFVHLTVIIVRMTSSTNCAAMSCPPFDVAVGAATPRSHWSSFQNCWESIFF